MTVRVVTAEQARGLDAATIRAGTPSATLMQRAGLAAVDVLLDRYADIAHRGVNVVCGPGNNGGDGWIVAAELERRAIPVSAVCCGDPRTQDAMESRAKYSGSVVPDVGGALIVDAMLGTGAEGELRGTIDDRVRHLAIARANGARVVALDLPTGVHADRGAGPRAVCADLTISFGTIKFGHLLARELCGEVVVVDIGLDPAALLALDAPELVDLALLRRTLPSPAPAAHKGQRGRVLIAGGDRGMAGASAYAAQGAFRAGAGMVRVVCAAESLPAVQCVVPQATALDWPTDADAATSASAWAHALVLGPGLGQSASAQSAARYLLDAAQRPTVLDADALDLALAGRREGRVLTPHRGEAARLLKRAVAEIDADPVSAAVALAGRTGDVVLLKGVPTIIATPQGVQYIVARGSLTLAQGGSGDLLAGIIGALLAQGMSPLHAAAIGAYAHGRAGELSCVDGEWRGVTLADIAGALPLVWREHAAVEPSVVLGVLPSIAHG